MYSSISLPVKNLRQVIEYYYSLLQWYTAEVWPEVQTQQKLSEEPSLTAVVLKVCSVEP